MMITTPLARSMASTTNKAIPAATGTINAFARTVMGSPRQLSRQCHAECHPNQCQKIQQLHSCDISHVSHLTCPRAIASRRLAVLVEAAAQLGEDRLEHRRGEAAGI